MWIEMVVDTIICQLGLFNSKKLIPVPAVKENDLSVNTVKRREYV